MTSNIVASGSIRTRNLYSCGHYQQLNSDQKQDHISWHPQPPGGSNISYGRRRHRRGQQRKITDDKGLDVGDLPPVGLCRTGVLGLSTCWETANHLYVFGSRCESYLTRCPFSWPVRRARGLEVALENCRTNYDQSESSILPAASAEDNLERRSGSVCFRRNCWTGWSLWATVPAGAVMAHGPFCSGAHARCRRERGGDGSRGEPSLQRSLHGQYVFPGTGLIAVFRLP